MLWSQNLNKYNFSGRNTSSIFSCIVIYIQYIRNELEHLSFLFTSWLLHICSLFLGSSSSVMMCDMMQEGNFPDNKKYIFAISHLYRKTKNYFPFCCHYRPFRRISCVPMTERLVETNLFIHDNEKMRELVSWNSRVVCSITPPTPLLQEEIVAFSIIG